MAGSSKMSPSPEVARDDDKTVANDAGKTTAEVRGSASPASSNDSKGISPAIPEDQAARSLSPPADNKSNPPLPEEEAPNPFWESDTYRDLQKRGWNVYFNSENQRWWYYHTVTGESYFDTLPESAWNNGTGYHSYAPLTHGAAPGTYNAAVGTYGAAPSMYSAAPGTHDAAPGTYSTAPGVSAYAAGAAGSILAPDVSQAPKRLVAGGYNPKIHGSFDPKADYAKQWRKDQEDEENAAAAAKAAITAQYEAKSSAYNGSNNRRNSGDDLTSAGTFNRYNGRFQGSDVNPDRYSQQNQASRQLNAYGGNLEAAANSHGGRSLKEERRKQRVSKEQIQAYKQKREERKRARDLAWYRSC